MFVHRVDGGSVALLHVLVLEVVGAGAGGEAGAADGEGVPQLAAVPEVGVHHALHRVARHVGRGQRQEACDQHRIMASKQDTGTDTNSAL